MGRPRIHDKVLSHDPFDISRAPNPGQLKGAKWFREITNGVDTFHIRRIHYRTLGKLKPDGIQ